MDDANEMQNEMKTANGCFSLAIIRELAWKKYNKVQKMCLGLSAQMKKETSS